MNIVKPHVSLNVTNIDAAVAFYEKVFGVAAAKRRPGYAKFDLAEPSLNLTMQEAPRTGVNASHFGVQVASSEDVAAAWTRFKQAGLPTRCAGNSNHAEERAELRTYEHLDAVNRQRFKKLELHVGHVATHSKR